MNPLKIQKEWWKRKLEEGKRSCHYSQSGWPKLNFLHWIYEWKPKKKAPLDPEAAFGDD
jgi:hypothetical protein